MSSEQIVLEKILSAGSCGIKKSDLRKEFTTFDLDLTLEDLIKVGKVCVDKKGPSYYCWTSELYLQHLNIVDPKFRILVECINSFERKLDNHSNSLKDAINKLIDVLKVDNLDSPNGLMNLDNFKIEFDTILSKSNNSI